MSNMTTITARNLDAEDASMIVMYLPQHRLTLSNPLKPEDAKKTVALFDCDRAITEIKRWFFSVGPGDVTYHKSFDNEDEYTAWRAELPCEDHEVSWDVLIEYESGGMTTFVCTGSQTFPEIFRQITEFARKAKK